MKRLLLLVLFAPLVLWAQTANNLPLTVLPSAARTAAAVNSNDLTNNQWRRTHVIIRVSAYTSGNYTPKLQGKDPTSGTYYDLLTGVAMSGTGTQVLKLGPGFGASANSSSPDMLPQIWRVQLNGAATPSMTFSVGAILED